VEGEEATTRLEIRRGMAKSFERLSPVTVVLVRVWWCYSARVRYACSVLGLVLACSYAPARGRGSRGHTGIYHSGRRGGYATTVRHEYGRGGGAETSVSPRRRLYRMCLSPPARRMGRVLLIGEAGGGEIAGRPRPAPMLRRVSAQPAHNGRCPRHFHQRRPTPAEPNANQKK